MIKRDVKTKEDLEIYYSKVRKIRFDENVEIKSFEDLYNAFLNNNKQNTYYVQGKLQCKGWKCRSLDEFIIIYKYYFPDNSVKDFFVQYNKLLDKIGKFGNWFSLYWCGNIRKRNYQTRSNGYSKTIFDVEYVNDQGFINCNLRWNEFLE